METIKLAGISNDSMIKATGKPWQKWTFFLDNKRADQLSTKEIVALLSQKIENKWWCQKIANNYKKARGKR